MWSKGHSIVTSVVTKEQMWQLLSDVNNWTSWDESVEMARLEGDFKKGNFFAFKPKGGPDLKIEINEAIPFKNFTDLTRFPLARMYGEHLLEETPAGLRITTTMKVEGILGFLWRKIVAQKIVDALPADLAHQVNVARKL